MEDPNELRRRIIESNYGRDGGWVVEYEGQPVAILTDCRSLEMFWDTYKIDVVTPDPRVRDDLLTNPSFWNPRSIVWRSRLFGLVAPLAFVAGDGIRTRPFTTDGGHLIVRALYLKPPPEVRAWYMHLFDWFTGDEPLHAAPLAWLKRWRKSRSAPK
jgi:hypothetical protein